MRKTNLKKTVWNFIYLEIWARIPKFLFELMCTKLVRRHRLPMFPYPQYLFVGLLTYSSFLLPNETLNGFMVKQLKFRFYQTDPHVCYLRMQRDPTSHPGLSLHGGACRACPPCDALLLRDVPVVSSPLWVALHFPNHSLHVTRNRLQQQQVACA